MDDLRQNAEVDFNQNQTIVANNNVEWDFDAYSFDCHENEQEQFERENRCEDQSALHPNVE